MSRAAPPSLALLLLATACQAEPIDLESVDTGTSGDMATATSIGTQLADDDGDDGGATPSPTITSGADDDGPATSITVTSGPWGDSGAITSGWDDGPGATTGPYSPCSGATAEDCADSAIASGVSCAFLPAFFLDSDASCTFEALGELCVEVQPADDGCVPMSCTEGGGRYHTSRDRVIELQDCTTIVDYDACVPGSPNTACACACISGLPG
jgi:hypothetical protein